MDDARLDALTRRLERVERENRWLRRTGALAVLLVGTVFLMGQVATSRVVDAERVVVRDPSGKVRLVLGEVQGTGDTSRSSYGVTLFDADAEATAFLYDQGTPRGARLFLLGPRSSASVGAEQEATVTLQTYKTARKEWDRFVAQLSQDLQANRITTEEHARLTGRGVTALALSVKDGEPSVLLSDDNRYPRAVIGPWRLVAPGASPTAPDVEQRGPGSIVLFDADRKVTWKAP